jgi:Arc/MetJ-type ribon-helix-helix transcriptional regulator
MRGRETGTEPPRERVTLRLPEPLLERLDAAADARHGGNRSAAVRTALEARLTGEVRADGGERHGDRSRRQTAAWRDVPGEVVIFGGRTKTYHRPTRPNDDLRTWCGTVGRNPRLRERRLIETHYTPCKLCFPQAAREK